MAILLLSIRMERSRFNINMFLSLELKGDKTYIYVNGENFRQCKYALLNIPIEDIDHYSKINSIDDVIYNLDHTLEESAVIPPETEFWAHCSNLQAWAENSYNTDLLDSILSFALLKKLTEVGDLQAGRVFKEEIAKRLMKGNINSIRYLDYEGYLEFLTYEELISIFSSEECPIFENIFKAYICGDSDQFSEANSLYISIGKYLFTSVKKKLKCVLESEDVNHLNIFLDYRMLDALSDNEILSLFEPPINLLERTLQILNKTNYEKMNIIYIGLFSERIKKLLRDRLKEKLLNILSKENIKRDLLWRLNLLKYIKNENVELMKHKKLSKIKK